MDINNICVFPYNKGFDAVLEYSNMITSEYEICALVAPRGWGLEGKKICIADSKELIVESNFDNIIEKANCILIPEFESTKKFEATVIEKLKQIIPHINKIICLAKLEKQNMDKLIELCAQCNGKCELEIRSGIKTGQDFNVYFDENDTRLEDIDVPIIAVAGLWENVDKFYTSLVLREQFIKNGYKISQIGSRNCCELMGFHSFPSFMFNPRVGEVEKIILFNRYVKKIVEEEQPDAIIIGIPGSIQSLNSQFSAGFGVIPLLVFKAISVDFLLMCTFFNYAGINLLKLISTSCLYNFDATIDCFHMSNFFIDLTMTEEKNQINSNEIDRKMVTKSLCENFLESTTPMLNLYDESEKEKLFNLVINKLCDNYVKIMNRGELYEV